MASSNHKILKFDEKNSINSKKNTGFSEFPPLQANLQKSVVPNLGLEILQNSMIFNVLEIK